MPLEPRHYKNLHRALCDALVRRVELEKMLQFELGQPLEMIDSQSNLSDAVFRVMQWAQAHGKLEQLVHAALQHVPGNRLLQDIADELAPAFERERAQVADTWIAVKRTLDEDAGWRVPQADSPSAGVSQIVIELEGTLDDWHGGFALELRSALKSLVRADSIRTVSFEDGRIVVVVELATAQAQQLARLFERRDAALLKTLGRLPIRRIRRPYLPAYRFEPLRTYVPAPWTRDDHKILSWMDVASMTNAMRDFVMQLVLAEMPGTTDAEDLTQEVLTELFDQLGWQPGRVAQQVTAKQLEDCLRSATTATIDAFRREQALETTSNESQLDRVDPSPGPSQIVISRESGVDTTGVGLDILEEAISSLSFWQRQVIRLRYFENVSDEEAANILNAPVNTIRGHLRHALDKLRARFAVRDSSGE